MVYAWLVSYVLAALAAAGLGWIAPHASARLRWGVVALAVVPLVPPAVGTIAGMIDALSGAFFPDPMSPELRAIHAARGLSEATTCLALLAVSGAGLVVSGALAVALRRLVRPRPSRRAGDRSQA